MVNLDENFTEDSKECSHLIPSLGSSGASMSTKTPGRELEDRWSLEGFLMVNLDENFTEASNDCSLLSDTITRFIRNIHVLQDSRKRLKGQVEACLGS